MTRLELQKKLIEVLGSNNVYFQPPETVKLKYPCIIYDLESEMVRHADDLKYHKHKRYQLTLIDKDPDSLLPDKLDQLEYCSFDRCYTADNLNHFVFTIYI